MASVARVVAIAEPFRKEKENPNAEKAERRFGLAG